MVKALEKQSNNMVLISELTNNTSYYVKLVAYDKYNNLKSEYAKGNIKTSDSGSLNGSYPINYSLDGNNSTACRFYNTSTVDYITYDFGYEILPVSYYILSAYGITECKISASKDGTDWVDISEIIKFNQSWNNEVWSNKVNKDFSTKETYRYFRFVGLSHNANATSINEFNIIGNRTVN